MQGLNITDITIFQLTERIKELEEKVNKKNNRTTTSRAQQMLLLKHCGIIEIIQGFNLQKKQTAKLLSILLNADETNIENDLSHINYDNPKLRTKKDYEFLIKTFEETGLIEKKKEAENILNKIPRK